MTCGPGIRGPAADGGPAPGPAEGMARMNSTDGIKVLVRSRKDLACLAAWAIIPEEGENASIAEDLLSKTRHGSPG
jgi:hypothetical protein